MLLWPFNKYPGTDYETYNWEWIIDQVKKYTNLIKDTITNLPDTIVTILNDHPEWFVMGKEVPYYRPEDFGCVCDGVTDDAAAFNHMMDVLDDYSSIWLAGDKKIRFDSPVIVKKPLNIRIDGEVLLTNTGTLQYGNTDNQVNGCKTNVGRITGDGEGYYTDGILIDNAAYNDFMIGYISNCVNGISFNKRLTNKSTGQNIFNINHIRNCRTGIRWYGPDITDFADAPWSEGNAIRVGFISSCSNAGVLWSDNIKCGCTLFEGPVDCAEAGGQDIVDNTNTTYYHQPNIIISNFTRSAYSRYGDTNIVLDTQTGIRAYANIISRTQVAVEDGDNSSILTPGGMEMCNTSYPYIDMKNNPADDFDTRIMSMNDRMRISAGDRTNNAYGFTLVNNKYVEQPVTGILTVPEGATTVNVPLNAMPGTGYTPIGTPNWNTTCYVSAKGAGYVTFTFGTAAPANATLNYVIQYGPQN